MERQSVSTAIWNEDRSVCGSGSRPPDMHAGLSACWRSCSSSYGLGTRLRSRRPGYASRRRIGRTLCCCSGCWWKIAVPASGFRARRAVIWHRHRLVQMRTRAMNQIQATAMNEGVRRKKTLWSKAGCQQLESLPLAPWATRRRHDLLELVDRLNGTIAELTAAVEQEAHKRPEVLRLMTHPGVGPITALAFVLVIGSPDRFACGKQIGSYLGLIPCEDSSADRQRLGHITKQGSSLVRYLLAEAAQAAVRWDPDWRRRYAHLSMRRDRRIAKVAMARRLAISLYWMWRKGYDYQQSLQFGSHAGVK